MNENETETNWYTLEEVIYERPYDTSPAKSEYRVNEELDDINQNYFIEKDETFVHDEEEEKLTKT